MPQLNESHRFKSRLHLHHLRDTRSLPIKIKMSPSAKAQGFILGVNAGSSSLKASLYDFPSAQEQEEEPKLVIKADISGLFSSSRLSYIRYTNSTPDDVAGKANISDAKIQTEKGAFEYLLSQLKEDELFRNDKEMQSIKYICHRVVHGGSIGEKGPAVLKDELEEELKQITTLAPLHNGPALSIIDSCKTALPRSQNVAFFDTTFHESMPEYVKTYAIDQKIAKRDGLRKYGFHGLSYQFIVKKVAAKLGKRLEDTNIIALHLGSGSSICAIKGGRSIDTSMGLTPLEGLPSGSRSGTIDPSLIFHYTTHPTTSDRISPTVHLSHSEALLNKSCGFKALTGSSDFSRVMKKHNSDKNCMLALEIFVDRILGYIGAYWLKLGGNQGCVDAIVFAGGIGESSADVRKIIVEEIRAGLGDLVCEIDDAKNGHAAKNKEDVAILDISKGESEKAKVFVCWTDEQMEMAQELCHNQTLATRG